MKTENTSERVTKLVRDYVALNVLMLTDSQARCDEAYLRRHIDHGFIDKMRSQQLSAARKIVEALDLEVDLPRVAQPFDDSEDLPF